MIRPAVLKEEATVYRATLDGTADPAPSKRFFTINGAYRRACYQFLKHAFEGHEELIFQDFLLHSWNDEGTVRYGSTSGKFQRCLAGMVRYWQWRDGVTRRPRRVRRGSHWQGDTWSTHEPKALKCEVLAAFDLDLNISGREVRQVASRMQRDLEDLKRLRDLEAFPKGSQAARPPGMVFT